MIKKEASPQGTGFQRKREVEIRYKKAGSSYKNLKKKAGSGRRKVMVVEIEAKPVVKPEVNIVWKYPPQLFSYLREGLAYSGSVRGPLRGWNGGGCWVKDMAALIKVASNPNKKSRFLMIGFKEKGERVATRVYQRRYWFLKSYDRDLQPDGVYKTRRPCEAVNPSSILEESS